MDNLTQGVGPASVSVLQPAQPFAQQSDSPLFSKLPGELRNEIIRLVVVEDSEIKPSISHSLNVLTGESTAKLEIEHPLMQTCKQLRQESAEIYFLENTFRLTEEFFTKPPLESCDQHKAHKANERAIHALAHAFGPWASKVRRLGVSHAVCYDTLMYGSVQSRWRLAEVHVSICRSAKEEGKKRSVYLECVKAHDTMPLAQEMCCCSIAQYAAEHSSAGLFELAQGLVHMLDVLPGQRSLPHCWTCGLEPMS